MRAEILLAWIFQVRDNLKSSATKPLPFQNAVALWRSLFLFRSSSYTVIIYLWFLFLSKWSMGNEVSKGITKGNRQWKSDLGICLAKSRKENVREINKQLVRQLLNFATSNISWKLSAAFKSLWSEKRQGRVHSFFMLLSGFHIRYNYVDKNIWMWKALVNWVNLYTEYLGHKSLNCTWMLLNYCFSTHQSQKRDIERELKKKIRWGGINTMRKMKRNSRGKELGPNIEINNTGRIWSSKLYETGCYFKIFYCS